MTWFPVHDFLRLFRQQPKLGPLLIRTVHLAMRPAETSVAHWENFHILDQTYTLTCIDCEDLHILHELQVKVLRT